MSDTEKKQPADEGRRSTELLGQLAERDPVAWIADWCYEHLLSGHAHKGPAMLWPDPRDLTGLVPLFDRATVDAAVSAERERWRTVLRQIAEHKSTGEPGWKHWADLALDALGPNVGANALAEGKSR